jgi:hypothetical protein
MVTPSILVAFELIKKAHYYTSFSYDSDDHPDWVGEVEEGVENEILSHKIILEFLPTWLEERLFEAVTEWYQSENIQALIDEKEQEEFERTHWYP